MPTATESPRGRTLLVVVAAVLAVALVGVALSTRDDGEEHRITAVVPSATNVIPGQFVRLGGVRVGEVVELDPADGGKAARVTIELGEGAWPLSTDTRMELRWGGTVRFADRYIELRPGTARAQLADGSELRRGRFTAPLEFDELMATFDADARKGLKDFLDQSGEAFGAAGDAARRALDASPPALTEASYVLRDLDEQRAAVVTIMRSGSAVLGAVDASSPGLRELLGGTASTFDAVADRASELQRSLEVAPGTLRTTRDTLKRTDGTLEAARRLLGDLSPGVTELRRTAAPLTGVLGSLRRVAPDATATLADLRGATPDLNPLLGRLRQQSPQLGVIAEQSVDALECLRPYTPEISALFANWASFTSSADRKDRLFRAQLQTLLPAPTNASATTPGQAADLYPGLEYGFPRPPGYLADQPWFNAECGYGPDALDPDKDPEARNSQPIAPRKAP